MSVTAAAPVGGVHVVMIMMVVCVRMGVTVRVSVIMSMSVAMVIVPIMMVMMAVVMTTGVRVADRCRRLRLCSLDLCVEEPCTDYGHEPPAQRLEPGFGRFHCHAGRAQDHDQNADDNQRRKPLKSSGEKR